MLRVGRSHVALERAGDSGSCSSGAGGGGDLDAACQEIPVMLPLRGDSLSSFFRERAQHSFFSLQIRGYTRGCVAKYKAFPKFKCRLDRCSGRVQMQAEPCNTARRGRGKSGGSHPGAGGPGLQAHSLRVPCCIHGQAVAPSGIVKTAEAQGEGCLCRTLSLYLDRTAPRRVSSGCVPDPASPPSCSALCPGSLHPLFSPMEAGEAGVFTAAPLAPEPEW